MFGGPYEVTSETTPASVCVNYTVNALGQVNQVTTSSDGGAASTIVSGASYYPNGAVKQFSYGNGIVHTMTQNARQLPSKSTDCTLAGTCAVANRRLDLGYSFDANGNVASITDGTTAGRQTRTMGYDNLDRLTSTTSPMFGTASYAYDALDNLKQVNVSGGTQARNHYYCYNTTNQLSFVRTGSNCSSSPAVTTLGYDVQGNLSNKNGTGSTFDFGNRLRTTASLTYRYDADGRRVRHNTAGDTQLKYSYYAKDGRVVWQRDEPGSKRISNIYFAGSLVAEYVRPIGSTAVTISYLHTDALGSPIAKTNASKTVIETSEYEPYGKLLNRANDDRAGYTGHVMDSASGLTYMQQRYYDPQIGRFLSVDPVTANSVNGSNFNRYWYANNSPYKFIDPDGREPGHLEKPNEKLTPPPPPPPPPPSRRERYEARQREAATNFGGSVERWDLTKEYSDSGSTYVDAMGKVKIEVSSNASPPTFQTGYFVAQAPIDANGKLMPMHAPTNWLTQDWRGTGFIGMGVTHRAVFTPTIAGPGGTRWYFTTPPGQASHDNFTWAAFSIFKEVK